MNNTYYLLFILYKRVSITTTEKLLRQVVEMVISLTMKIFSISYIIVLYNTPASAVCKSFKYAWNYERSYQNFWSYHTSKKFFLFRRIYTVDGINILSEKLSFVFVNNFIKWALKKCIKIYKNILQKFYTKTKKIVFQKCIVAYKINLKITCYNSIEI